MMQGYTNEVTKKAWPRWAVSPTGDRAVVHCAGDMHPGWKLEIPLTREQAAQQVGGDPRDAQMADMRAELEELKGLLGKKAKSA